MLISVNSLRIFFQVKIGIAETVVCLRIARLAFDRLIVSGNGLLVLLVVKKLIALSVEVFGSRLRLIDNNWCWLMSTAAARLAFHDASNCLKLCCADGAWAVRLIPRSDQHADACAAGDVLR